MFKLQLCPLYTATPVLALYNTHFVPHNSLFFYYPGQWKHQLLLNIHTYIPIYKASWDLHSYGNLCTNELNSKRKWEASIIILCKWYHNSNTDLIMTHYSQLLASLATSYVLWSVVIQSATDTNGYTSQLKQYHSTINLLHKIHISTSDIKNSYVSTFSDYWNWWKEKHWNAAH